uniref:Aminoglycoside phosphotransferase domain-containing protein n=1 Tax=uncultured Thiotrichaceae bacterium TaxID=298394 RepID=A0A6S6UM39_9GAMM|nr:MAG: Unknown protein [uncultured Thiotrichaceae bacterium]
MRKEIAPVLSTTVQDKIKQQLKQNTGQSNWQITDFVRHTRESILYQAHHPQYPHTIGIKCFRQQKSVADRYQSMLHYHSQMNNDESKHRVPQVHGHLEEEGIIMMEWVRYPTLRRQLWKNVYKQNTQQKHLQQMLLWLQTFHQQSPHSHQPIEAQRYVRILENLLPAYQGYGLLLQQNNLTFRNAMACMHKQAEELQGVEIPHAYIHHDFSLANVLTDKSNVVGIDFSAKHYLPAAEDITHMLTTVSMTYPNMVTKKDMKPHHPLEQWPLVKLFLETYQYPTEPLQIQALSYLFLHKLMHHWIWKGATTHGYVPGYGKDRKRNWKRGLQNRWTLYKLEQMTEGVTQTLLKA